MDKEFKTTFIPKKNINRGPKHETKQARVRKSFISLLSFLLFVTAIVSTIGVYIYKVRLAVVINSHVDSINRAEKAFEPSAILDLKKLDIRLQAGTDLLNNHIAISDFLDSLSESTLPGISFLSFSFSDSGEESSVSMSGEARGYIQIAQQSDIFEDNQYIQNHIFSNFSLTDSERVTFSLEFHLNRKLLTFGRTVKNNEETDIIIHDHVIISERDKNKVEPGVPIKFNSPNNL